MFTKLNSSQKSSDKKLILIIDDDKYYREILRIKLKKAGYEIIEASGGVEGLEMLSKYRPDLILIDLVMPRMNGLEMLLKLKNHPVGKYMKIIVMTNKVDIQEEIGQQYEKMIKKLGALDFISKSEDLNKILEKIKEKLAVENNDKN